MKQYRLILLCILTHYSCTAEVMNDTKQNMIVEIPEREPIIVEGALGAVCNEDLECESFYCFCG